MSTDVSATLTQLSGFLKTECLPELKDAVDAAVDRHITDKRRNGYKFGTWLWSDILECFKDAASREGAQFRIIRRGGVAGIHWQGYFITHHRVDPDTQIPNGAEAAKKYARENTRTPFLNLFDENISVRRNDWAVLGFDATPEDGLLDVFVGIMSADIIGREGWTYSWLDKESVWSPGKLSGSTTPVESDVTPEVKLRKPEVEKDPEVDVRKREDGDDNEKSQSV